MKITEALFAGSSTRISERPKQVFPEFAFIGRSNVGKSSLINMLCNNSKLAKIPYHPKKCEVFLEISGITDPDWTDAGGTIQLEYWINLCTQYFLENEIYDEETGNRIYFDL